MGGAPALGTTSIGITQYLNQVEPEDTLLKHADVAIHMVLHAASNLPRFYKAEVQATQTSATQRVCGQARQPNADTAVRQAVDFGWAVSVQVAAIGVHTTDQLEHLRQHACQAWQGNPLARPMDAAAFAALAGDRHDEDHTMSASDRWAARPECTAPRA